MTTSGGTGRPTTAGDGRAEVSQTEGTQAGAPSAPGNGAPSTTKASTAYEVAAALRAQASRAAQATREAASRVQNAVTTPERDVRAKTGDTESAGPIPGQQPGHGSSDSPMTGAAAAVAATAPTRGRAPVQPASRPATQPEGSPAATQRVAQPAPQHEPRAATAAQHVAPPSAPERGYQGGADTASPMPELRENQRPTYASVAPAPPIEAPPAQPAPAPPSTPDDTQVSLDARPHTPPPTTPPRTPQRSTAPVRRTTRVRKARLRLMRIDPWSVMKTAFLLAVALGITLFVAVAVLWSVLDAAGVFTAVGDLVRDLTQSDTSGGVNIEDYTALSRVLGFTTLIAVVDVVLVTALATLGAFLYNLSASLLGGLEVTLAEDD